MKVKRLSIKNIMGIEDAEIEPGRITLLRAGNGQGKSSTIAAIKVALGLEHDPRILRDGEDRGHVILLLDDGTRIRRGVTRKRITAASVKSPDGENLGQSYLDRLMTQVSVNPISFIDADEKTQIEMLLRHATFSVEDEEIEQAGMVGPEEAQSEEWRRLDKLARIEHAHKRLTAERRELNRSIRDREGTIRTTRESLPEGDLETARTEQKVLSERCAELKSDLEKRSKEIIEAAGEHGSATEKWFSKMVDELRAERDRRLHAGREAKDQALSDLSATTAHLKDLESEYAVKAEQIRSLERAAGAADMAAGMEGEVERDRTTTETMTDALRKLEGLKVEAMKYLPVDGLEIIDGELRFDNLPFRMVNTAEQIRVALNLATVTAGELGIILLDGIERLQPSRRAKVIEAIKAREDDLHYILTEVVESENLEVITE